MVRKTEPTPEKQFQKELIDKVDDIARALVHLGKGTSYEPGAVEFLAMQVRDSVNYVAEALFAVAQAINNKK